MYWTGQDEDDEDDQNSFSLLKDRAKEMDLNWSNVVYIGCEQNLRKDDQESFLELSGTLRSGHQNGKV